MKLSRRDPETDMEMNMTPMIDVVFLLIIFFMIITDLTQQELEDLELPRAEEAVEDKPNPEDRRPILNMMQDGRIIVRRELKYDPEDPQLSSYDLVSAYLQDMAARMRKEPISATNSTLVPDEPVLIRADEFTPFRHVQQVMQLCGQTGIQIWKIELAAKQPDSF